MRVGSLVRFAEREDVVDIDDWSTTPKNHVGILIEYDKIMHVARVLYDGEVRMVRIQLAELAGGKTLKNGNQNAII